MGRERRGGEEGLRASASASASSCAAAAALRADLTGMDLDLDLDGYSQPIFGCILACQPASLPARPSLPAIPSFRKSRFL